MVFKKVIVLLILLISVNCWSFDGSRKGFVMGLGIGLGNHTKDYTSSTGNSNYSTSGLGTEFLIGAGITNHWLLYYNASRCFYTSQSGGGAYNQIGIIGTRLFVYDSAPSPYLSLSGPMSIGKSLEGGSKAKGTGMQFGLGFEYASHFGIELRVLRGTIETDEWTTVFNTVQFMVNAIAF